MNRQETHERDLISAATAFDAGAEFETASEVRAYFTLGTMTEMFGADWPDGGRAWNEPAPLWTQGQPWTQDDLDIWAALVIEGQWHCRFRRLSVPEAASALGIDTSAVRHAIARGALAARKLGRDWWIDPAEVDRYARERGPHGRAGAPRPRAG